MQNPEMESVENTSNLVKSKAYQARSELEEDIAKIDAISAKIFLGDRQLANQTTGLLRQQIEIASSGITTDENIIKSLDHSLAIRARLLEHRCYHCSAAQFPLLKPTENTAVCPFHDLGAQC